MRAGRAQHMPQKIGQQHARLGLARDLPAVQFEANRMTRSCT
jgi:hypothetical protein